MFSSIVVGTDGSQTAKRAVAIAAEMARRFDARLHLVNSFRDPGEEAPVGASSVRDPQTSPSMWRQSSEAVLAEALADPALAGVEVEIHSVVGGVAQMIVEVANRVGADLIVVGNRGMRGAGHSGESVPNSVAHQAPCHVLIAKTT
jgi:nucleotide-binding universal stress UspA family protein